MAQGGTTEPVKGESQLEEEPPSVPRDTTQSNDCLVVTDSDPEETGGTHPETQCACSEGGRDGTGEAGDGRDPEDSAVVQSQELGNATATVLPVDGSCANSAHICTPQQQGEAAPQGQETRGCRQPHGNEGTPFKQIDREPHGVVHSLFSTKIPPCNWKIIHAEVRGGPGATLLLFTPSQSLQGLAMAEAAILGSDGIQETLMVQNSSTVPIVLEAGKELGTATIVEQVEFSELSNKQRHTSVVSQLEPKLEVWRVELIW